MRSSFEKEELLDSSLNIYIESKSLLFCWALATFINVEISIKEKINFNVKI